MTQPNLKIRDALNKNTAVEWNQTNFTELLKYQEEKAETCFFVGLYGLSAAIYPDRTLPPADEFINSIRSCYSHVLERNSLSVKYDQIESALNIYKEWGIDLTNLTLNDTGESMIGRHIKNKDIPLKKVSGFQSLNITDLDAPYSILVHPIGGNNSHYLTIDGTEKTRLLMKKYLEDNYKIIATFEFKKNQSNFGFEEPVLRGIKHDGNVIIRRAA